MINFVVRDARRAEMVLKIRRMVVTWTTLIFGVYVVAMSGFLGWKIFWNSKEKRTSEEEVQLRKEISQLSENEILAIRLSDRGSEIQKFLAERGQVTEQAKQIPNDSYTIFGWEYFLNKDDIVTVIGQNPTHLKGYEDYLRGFYSKVKLESLMYDSEAGWILKLSVDGWKRT